jgi:hypothetical protein
MNDRQFLAIMATIATWGFINLWCIGNAIADIEKKVKDITSMLVNHNSPKKPS